jgi:hypothetical protein
VFRLLCFALLLAILLFFAIASSPGSAEPAINGNAPTIETAASSNSSSCTITITMTGIVGDPGDLGDRG